MKHDDKSLGADAAAVAGAGSIAPDAAIARHTPGPWTFTTDDSGVHRIKAEAEIEWGALFCDEKYYPWCSSNEADWHLIAAAPELLEALKGLMAQFDAGYFVRNIENDGRPDWAIQAARSVRTLAIAVQAIAKAEGRR